MIAGPAGQALGARSEACGVIGEGVVGRGLGAGDRQVCSGAG